MNPEDAEVNDDVIQIPKGITEQTLLEQMSYLMPIKILPKYSLAKHRPAAFAVIDEVKGFCLAGCGPLAPPTPDSTFDSAIEVTNGLALKFNRYGEPIIVVREWHKNPEPPHPPHCEAGSEQAELVEKLAWLEKVAALQVYKDCIGGWVGAERMKSKAEPAVLINDIFGFLYENQIRTVVVAGFCTNICDLQLVCPLLHARNSRLLPDLEDVVVCTSAVATYNLPLAACRQIGLVDEAAHPRGPNHYFGLNLMMHAGAILAEEVCFD